jgi:hypothetical protein
VTEGGLVGAAGTVGQLRRLIEGVPDDVVLHVVARREVGEHRAGERVYVEADRVVLTWSSYVVSDYLDLLVEGSDDEYGEEGSARALAAAERAGYERGRLGV